MCQFYLFIFFQPEIDEKETPTLFFFFYFTVEELTLSAQVVVCLQTVWFTGRGEDASFCWGKEGK